MTEQLKTFKFSSMCDNKICAYFSVDVAKAHDMDEIYYAWGGPCPRCTSGWMHVQNLTEDSDENRDD